MSHDRVEAVERALSILESFSEASETLSLAELAEETGLYKSTILRLCASLQRFGYISKGEHDGRFRLGPSLCRLGAIYMRNFDLGEVIRPWLKKLSAATGETASYCIRDGHERICLYRHNSTSAIRHHLDEGSRLPLDRGAAGRVLRAFTERRMDDRGVIAKGYAMSVGERSPDVAAVAVPIFDGTQGVLRGAMAVSGLSSRFDEEARMRAVVLLKEAAEAVAGEGPLPTRGARFV